MTTRGRVAVALAVAATLATQGAASGRAQAADDGVRLTLDSNTGNLVPGAATVPAFHMDFLLDDAGRLDGVPLGTTHDLEISLTSPNSPVFHFLFSPRAQFGIGYDPIEGASRAYIGLTWNLLSDNSIYGNLGLAGSFDPGGAGAASVAGRVPDAPLMFHGAVEFGYRVDQNSSLSLAIDQGVVPNAHGSGPEPIDNFLLRFGGKF
jgi:hypothetical protein